MIVFVSGAFYLCKYLQVAPGYFRGRQADVSSTLKGWIDKGKRKGL